MELATVQKNVPTEEVFLLDPAREAMEFAALVTTSFESMFQIHISSSFLSVQFACGDTSSENCTYFQSNGKEVGQCRLKICPCSEHICQLRLDFSQFVLHGPYSTATSVNKIGGKTVYEELQCQTDLFSVTAPGNNAPPVICGTNSGQHSNCFLYMYLNLSLRCTFFS